MKKISHSFLLAGIIQMSFLAVASADPLDSWTTNQITTNSFQLDHIAYGNGCYVVTAEAGDAGAIYSSADGMHWTLRYSDNNGWGLTMIYSGGHFVGVGGVETAISSDGTNWTVLFLPLQYEPSGNTADMTFGNGVNVEVGQTNGVGSIITSPNTIVWTSRTTTPSIGGPISSVVYGTQFVAVGNNDGIEYTAAGSATSWTRRSIPGGSQISFGNGLYLVPLTGGSNLVSTDGINWNMLNTGLTNMCGRIIYANGLYLARAGSYLATSSDGTNWLQQPQIIPNVGSFIFNYVGTNMTFATDGVRLATIGSVFHTFPQMPDGIVYLSDVLIGVRPTNGPVATVALAGLLGRQYQIQSIDALSAGVNLWHTNMTLRLTNTPYVWTDATATNSSRFYRGVLLP